MRTTSNKILISIIKDEATKNSLGLTLPSSLENEGIEKAVVIYSGDKVDTQIPEGTEIYIYRGAGKEFTSPEDDKKYRVISVADILVIF